MSKESNRAAMPTIAGVVDLLREHFPDTRVLYAAEGGCVVGKRDTEGFVAEGWPCVSHALGSEAVKAMRSKRK